MGLFGIFFLMTLAQFHTWSRSAFAWAGLITVAMGALVELAEGVSGSRNCRLRDVVPDAAGAVLGMGFALLWIGARLQWQTRSSR